MKWPWARGTDSESGRPEAVLEQIVHACLERQEPQTGVAATELRGNIDERLRNESPKFLSWAQESRDRLDSALAEAARQASRTEFAGWAIAGALAMYLALALCLPGSGTGLDAEIIAGLAVALVGRLAWRLRLFARGERKISDARKHWEKVLEEAIALPLIAQEVNLLLGNDVADTMDMAVATLTGNGRDPEVPVISAAMRNVAMTARTIGSGSIGVSGPRGAGKSTVLNKFDTRDAAWKSEQDIRVTVAAPVDYDAREFIIHLFTELCTRVAAEAPPQDRIARLTQRHLEDLRFQRTYSSSWGPTLTPASFLSFAWSRGRERAEQPAGLPALVARFRAYSQQVAEWNWDRNRDRSQVSNQAQGQVQRPVQGRGQEGVGRVIICIDEMDKIRDSDRAEQFLNNIKAIFDVPGCLYLVAISEDAMTVFASQTPAIRTAFDSAFDEIISVPPMEFPDARQLLQLRTTGVPLPFLALCHVLAGGVPRELIRAARALMQEAEPPEQEGLKPATPDGSPAPQWLVTLGVLREKLIRTRCEVMRREAILQLSRSGAGGDILTPLHQPHWPGDPAGRLTSGALEEAAVMLNGAAAAPGNAQWATMCQDVAVALSFYAVVTRLFDGDAPLVVQSLRSMSDPRVDDGRLIDDLAIARHAMRTNSQLAAELLARLPVPGITGASSGAR
jgi:KAP family P-loop domain